MRFMFSASPLNSRGDDRVAMTTDAERGPKGGRERYLLSGCCGAAVRASRVGWCVDIGVRKHFAPVGLCDVEGAVIGVCIVAVVDNVVRLSTAVWLNRATSVKNQHVAPSSPGIRRKHSDVPTHFACK